MRSDSPQDKMSTEAKFLPPPRAYDFDSMIILLVGPEEQRMTVHREFLGQSSKFFQAALKEEWAESREIKLPEELPIHMGYYIGHLYGQKLPTHVIMEKSQCHPGILLHYGLLAELYVLGERRLDAKYQNLIMHGFFRLAQLSGNTPGAECANAIYQGTTTESPARRMMVDYAARCKNDCWIKDIRDEAPDTDFWRDLSKVLIKKVQSADGKKPDALNVGAYLVCEDT
jgi:hypothetical protein